MSKKRKNKAKKKVIQERCEYDKSLTDWIKDNPITMKLAYPSATKDFEKMVPTEDAIMVVRGLLTAFFNLLNSKEKHPDLKCPENYLLTSPIFDYHSPSGDKYAEASSVTTDQETNDRKTLNSAGEYTRKVKVIIIRDSNSMHEEATKDLESSKSAIISIIFDHIFRKQNDLPEWADLRDALSHGKFEYADAHPCLWSWKKRLLFFVDLCSYMNNRGPDIRKIACKAVDNMNLPDEDWWMKLKGLGPLERVYTFNSPGNFSNARGAVKRQNLIRFMRNCYSHLTEVRFDKDTGTRVYWNIVDRDNIYYLDLRFFNHLVTHKLYPRLWIELFAKLHKHQYRF